MTTKGRAKYPARKKWSEIPSNGAAESNGGDLRSSLLEAHGFESTKVTRFYPPGSILFAEDQRPPGVYVLCEGRAKVWVASAEGKTAVLRIAEVGDLLGLGSVLTDRPSDATVETLERCRIDFVSRADLLKLLDRDQRACLAVARALSKEVSSLASHTRLLLLSESAAAKLARLLVTWGDEHGKRTAQGIRINSGLTHEELGQLICVSRETVTRLLAELKRKQILILTGGAIFIRNRKALESVTRL